MALDLLKDPTHLARRGSLLERLPAEQASYIDALVASGNYASASEVVRAGLRALQERDSAMERWLRDDVAATYDAMQTDPSRGIPADQVAQRLRDHHAARMKDPRGV